MYFFTLLTNHVIALERHSSNDIRHFRQVFKSPGLKPKIPSVKSMLFLKMLLSLFNPPPIVVDCDMVVSTPTGVRCEDVVSTPHSGKPTAEP